MIWNEICWNNLLQKLIQWFVINVYNYFSKIICRFDIKLKFHSCLSNEWFVPTSLEFVIYFSC